MEEWHANQRVWDEREQVGYEPDDHGKALGDARIEIEERAFAIQPQTVAGLAALVEIVRSYFGPELPGCDNWALHSLLDSVEAMADAVVA